MNDPYDSYTPDPMDSARLVVGAFLDRLGEDLAGRSMPQGEADRLRRAIDAERERLLEPEQDEAGEAGEAGGGALDVAARANRLMTATVLAASRVLGAEPGLPGGDELVAWLTRAFVEPLQSFVGEQTRAMLDAAPDPFTAMTAYARQREEVDFGVEFEFRHPVDDDDRFHADVHRCGFHGFFQRHGAPELTPVFCAFDANWIDAIDPERHGFGFTRPMTIGLGGTTCPFHFERRTP